MNSSEATKNKGQIFALPN